MTSPPYNAGAVVLGLATRAKEAIPLWLLIVASLLAPAQSSVPSSLPSDGRLRASRLLAVVSLVARDSCLSAQTAMTCVSRRQTLGSAPGMPWIVRKDNNTI